MNESSPTPYVESPKELPLDLTDFLNDAKTNQAPLNEVEFLFKREPATHAAIIGDSDMVKLLFQPFFYKGCNVKLVLYQQYIHLSFSYNISQK